MLRNRNITWVPTCSVTVSVFSFQLGELFRFLLLSGKKQKGGKRSFAESFTGITAVAEVSEQVVKYLERHRLCWDLLLTHLTHVAFLVLHQFPMKIRTRGFVPAKARARAWPSVVLLLPFHPWEDPKMVLGWFLIKHCASDRALCRFPCDSFET